MRFVLVFTYLCFSIVSFGQKDWTEIPELKEFKALKNYYDSYYWEDTITKNQVEFFFNGVKSVYYENLNSKTKIRYDYFYYNGNIHNIAEVYQKFKIDTFWQINAVTLEDEQVIVQGISDVYNGKFIEYYKDENKIKHPRWSDSLSMNQIDSFGNGTIKTRYEDIDNNTKIRFDYYHNGELQRKSIVHQEYRIDTTWQINAVTLEDEQVVIAGYEDKVDSILYYAKAKVKLKGQFEDDKQVGLWQLFLDNKIVEVTFDENGLLKKGIYSDFYILNNEKGNLKSQGAYLKKVQEYTNDYGYKTKKVFYIKKGKWIYYKKDGSIKQTIKY